MSNHGRASFSHVDPEKTYKVYKAYVALGKLLRDPVNQIELKLDAGEMATMDNTRVLHGRTAFQVTEEGSRLLEVGYVDWDMAYARLRVLAQKYNVSIDI